MLGIKDGEIEKKEQDLKMKDKTPKDVPYNRRKHRINLLEKYKYSSKGRCTNEEHYWDNCKCSLWEEDYFKRLLNETNVTNYIVNGKGSVTPLYGKWCELKLDLMNGGYDG